MTYPRLAHRRGLLLAALGTGVLTAALALIFTLGSGPTRAGAADHLDAPGLTPPGGDVRLDITDVYAFQSPGNSGNTVLVMNVNGFTEPGKLATFAPAVPSVARTRRATYNFKVDNNGDARPDVNLSTTFGRPNAAGVQAVTVRRNGKVLVRGRTTGLGRNPSVSGTGGVQVFAGLRDDPFYFDLQGFLNILSKEAGKSFLGCKAPRTDAFAKRNVSSLVLELPSRLLTRAGKPGIGVWSTTERGSVQVDRMGRPAIATVFVPQNPFEPKEESLKNTYNRSQPATDRAKFRSEVVDSLTVLFSLNDMSGDDPADDAKKISGLADVLLPDILTFNVQDKKGFLNGRQLADDVIDAELGLITEGAVTTDCVGKNDKTFSKAFPYLAKPF